MIKAPRNNRLLALFRSASQSDGDVISSKAVSGTRRVFRLEAILEAGVEELHDLLFLKVEEMHRWNPSVQQVKVSSRLLGSAQEAAVDDWMH